MLKQTPNMWLSSDPIEPHNALLELNGEITLAPAIGLSHDMSDCRTIDFDFKN